MIPDKEYREKVRAALNVLLLQYTKEPYKTSNSVPACPLCLLAKDARNKDFEEVFKNLKMGELIPPEIPPFCDYCPWIWFEEKGCCDWVDQEYGRDTELFKWMATTQFPDLEDEDDEIYQDIGDARGQRILMIHRWLDELTKMDKESEDGQVPALQPDVS